MNATPSAAAAAAAAAIQAGRRGQVSDVTDHHPGAELTKLT